MERYEELDTSEPGYRVLRWFVDKIRQGYSRKDPVTFKLIDADFYCASVAMPEEGDSQEIISPVISAVGFYQNALQDPTIRLE